MEKRKIVGIISITVSIVFLFDSQITGAIISASIGTSISFFVGIVLLIGGLVSLRQSFDAGTNDSPDYYRERVKEMFDPKYDHQDVVIAQSELSGILKEIQTNPYYKKPNIEHGIENPNIHMTGGPGVPKFLPHLDVKTKNKGSRHLILTSDPNDPKLRNIGIVSAGKTKEGLEKGKRVASKVYLPNHPRSQDIGKMTLETLSPSQRKGAA